MIGCNSLLFNHCLPLIQDLRIKSCKFVFPQKFAKRCIQAEMIANSGKNLQGGSDRSKKKFDLWFDQLWKIIIQNLYSLSAIICKNFHFLHSPLSSDDKQIIQFLSLIIGGSFLANKEPQLCICICLVSVWSTISMRGSWNLGSLHEWSFIYFTLQTTSHLQNTWCHYFQQNNSLKLVAAVTRQDHWTFSWIISSNN